MNDFKPQIIAFCCTNCASSAVQVAEGMKKRLPENVKMIQVPCTGRIEVLHLLKPFEEGADGVYVAGCQEDSCQYVSGITKAAKRVEHVKKILEELDIEPERINVFNLYAGKGQEFVQVAQEMTDKIRELGPVM
ncbi:MAG: hydrogenase iron-sulfur subunit [Deltaproteobacteria bacterium]|nr:hydrogenase iron-sulfur subunit [Deltaproteobacteria bacterium]MBW2117883.1 hydrogenase iron-sulfur subunit [Deltaproteobacteria bacterium]MBW2344428.1 hydrogenase iron-sulfur subunit [Deltaproteobacteria bacterium]